MNSRILVISIALLTMTTGCQMAKGVHEYRPIAKNVEKASVSPNQIEVFQKGTTPNRPVVWIANVAAHGNGYADNSTLIEVLVNETSKIGGELVLITNKEITADETIATYSGGLMMADTVKRPHLYGVAGVYSKVQIGIHAKDDGTIMYVTSNTPAHKAGLKEGMRILAINGDFFNGSQILEKHVSPKSPGDIVTVEYLDHDKSKKSVDIILTAPI